jgi:hypothetical protein
MNKEELLEEIKKYKGIRLHPYGKRVVVLDEDAKTIGSFSFEDYSPDEILEKSLNIRNELIGLIERKNHWLARNPKTKKFYSFSRKVYGDKKAKEYAKKVLLNPESINEIKRKKNHIKNIKNEYIKKDKYSILKINEPNNDNQIKLKIDTKNIEKLKKYKWGIDLRGEDYFKIRSHDMYIEDIILPGKDNIQFKNKDRKDFREENLIRTKKKRYIKAPKYEESNKQIPGVTYREIKGRYSGFVATITRGDMRKTKSFSINKYGYEEAKNLAIETRLKWEEKYDN